MYPARKLVETLSHSEFLKNVWVWWYSLRSKVVESNFVKYMMSLVFHYISSQ